jgi:hypothetical protein
MLKNRRKAKTEEGSEYMRMNNFSSRLKVNEWLRQTGREPLSADLSYEEFAADLRKITATKNVQVPFASRADAVAYIRHIASSLKVRAPSLL